jgi:hypothetical protein
VKTAAKRDATDVAPPSSDRPAAPGRRPPPPRPPAGRPSPPATNAGVIEALWMPEALAAAGGWRARRPNHSTRYRVVCGDKITPPARRPPAAPAAATPWRAPRRCAAQLAGRASAGRPGACWRCPRRSGRGAFVSWEGRGCQLGGAAGWLTAASASARAWRARARPGRGREARCRRTTAPCTCTRNDRRTRPA